MRLAALLWVFENANQQGRMAEFTHLHLHTQYSLLDGAIRVKELFDPLIEKGMKQVAMTDHGNLFGAVDFYQTAKAHGVKPIMGCEAYVADDRKNKSDRKRHHMILLAKNEVGWKNLQYMVSMGFLEGFYYNPRIDKKLLKERGEGIIGLSACLGGEVAQTIMRKGTEAAIDVARAYDDALGRGNFFLEMQPNRMAEQEEVNGELIKISRKTGIPLAATNDCHYLKREQARAHEILMCVQQKRTIHDDKRMAHKSDEFFLKSPAEMDAYFKDIPEAMENAAMIGEMCKVEMDLGSTYYLPRFKLPDGYDEDSWVIQQARNGLKERIMAHKKLGRVVDEEEYDKRLERELGIIKTMGFSGYFLIVCDFIQYAKKIGVPVGPGRGSGAGSLVAYCLRITDIDPILHKLLFERFLNPERVSMPDFDVDFCMNRRDEVIDYVQEKYGRDNVGQIVTMHQLKARSCIRDVARAMGLPASEGNRIASLVPEAIQGKTLPIGDAIDAEPRLKEVYDGEHRELLDVAQTLEGLNRHAGMHAAGVVIGENPLWEYVPLFKPAGEDTIVTQYNMTEVELAGLVKFDFLGLKTLTVIQTTVDLVNKRRVAEGKEPLVMEDVSTDDPDVFKMISAADVTGVFQLESSGFRELLKGLKPDCFEDIIAAGALYRPGPIEGGMVDDFIDRKHGRKAVVYDHPTLEPILEDTYGVIVYQEQVMQIASAMAGYSLGGADLLRRAMGKKKVEVMAIEKEKFLKGAKERDVDLEIAEKVFDLMAKFAGYGFNRSHSAAYGLLTYHTAYLKHYYPVEFFAGLMTCDKHDTDSVVKFINEARTNNIRVRRPDVNESDADFNVVPDNGTSEDDETGGTSAAKPDPGKAKNGKVWDRSIRFGLGAVKGVGEGAVQVVLDAREKGGPFLSVFDFCNRVDTRKVNRKTLEALVKSGAFDGIAKLTAVSRSRLFSAINPALDRAVKLQKERDSGQTSLMALFSGDDVEAEPAGDVFDEEMPEWIKKELLAFEKESLGFYISGHPLDSFARDIKRFSNATTANCISRGPRAEVTIAGVVVEYQERSIKNSNGKYAFFKLEDQAGQMEFHVGAPNLLSTERFLPAESLCW